jgi:hypothetical protein
MTTELTINQEADQRVLECLNCGVQHSLGLDCYIQDAVWYVVCTDRFTSGWGPAHSAVNYCVVPCNTPDDRDRIVRYMHRRTDTIRVRILRRKPRSRPNVIISNLTSWLETSKGPNEPKGENV